LIGIQTAGSISVAVLVLNITSKNNAHITNTSGGSLAGSTGHINIVYLCQNMREKNGNKDEGYLSDGIDFSHVSTNKIKDYKMTRKNKGFHYPKNK